MARVLRVCATCGVERPSMDRCSRCAMVYYCGRECQRVGWPRHRPVCGKTLDGDAPHVKAGFSKRDGRAWMDAAARKAVTALKDAGLPAEAEDWSAARLEALMDCALIPFLINHMESAADHQQDLVCSMLRVLGLLTLRAGSRPSSMLLEMLRQHEECAPPIPPPPANYPVAQARIGARGGAGVYEPFPRGHALRGAYDSNEVTLLDLLEQRYDDGRRIWKAEPELGLGADGHGLILSCERLCMELCGVSSRVPER